MDLIQDLDYFDKLVQIFLQGDPSLYIDSTEEGAIKLEKFIKQSNFLDTVNQ